MGVQPLEGGWILRVMRKDQVVCQPLVVVRGAGQHVRAAPILSRLSALVET